MTKKYAITIVVILLVVVCSVFFFLGIWTKEPASQEKEIAKIGNYPITESTLREYVFLVAEDTTSVDSVKSLETAAKDYAKSKIAAEEIAGTEYDISPEYRKELIARENENTQNNLEEDSAYCAQQGITLEELTSATITSKMDIAIMQKHCQLFYDKLQETEKSQGQEISHTADELLALYEEYLEKKVAEMDFVILDTERVNNVQTFLDSILEKSEK